MLLLKLGSIAIVPVIYSVVLGEDAFFERMRVQGELLKMLFLTFYHDGDLLASLFLLLNQNRQGTCVFPTGPLVFS